MSSFAIATATTVFPADVTPIQPKPEDIKQVDIHQTAHQIKNALPVLPSIAIRTKKVAPGEASAEGETQQKAINEKPAALQIAPLPIPNYAYDYYIYPFYPYVPLVPIPYKFITV